MKRLLPILGVILVYGTVLSARPLHAPPPRPSDAELVRSVRSALHASLGNPAGQIDVAIQNGFVFLYGEVPSGRMRARAETIAGRVAGVRAVSNELVLARDRAVNGGTEVAAGSSSTPPLRRRTATSLRRGRRTRFDNPLILRELVLLAWSSLQIRVTEGDCGPGSRKFRDSKSRILALTAPLFFLKT